MDQSPSQGCCGETVKLQLMHIRIVSPPGHIECCVSNKLSQRSLRGCPQYFGCIPPLNGTAICCSKQWNDKGSLSSSQMWQLRSGKNACVCLHFNYTRGLKGYRYKSGVWQPNSAYLIFCLSCWSATQPACRLASCT